MIRSVLYILFGIMISALVLLFVRGGGGSWICRNGSWVRYGKPKGDKPAVPCQKKGGTMKVTSARFSDGGEIPVEYTCQGQGMSPPITVSGIPPRTQTLALTLDDPDAPGGTFRHWIVWGIPAGVTEIPQDGLPDGSVMGTNSAGLSAYMPPCPPTGTHRYVFTVFALDTVPHIEAGASHAEFTSALRGHVLLEAELTGVVSAR